MRYALIAVATGASLLCAFVAWRLALAEQLAIPPDDPDYAIVIVLVIAAIVLAFAAWGLIAQRAEGAYLLGIAAWILVIPLFTLGMLSFMAWDTSQATAETRERNDLTRLAVWGALGLDVWVAVAARRLEKRLSRERADRIARHDP